MRRGSRIAASVAATGAIITGAGVALGGVPSPATHASAQSSRPDESGSTVELDHLAAQAISEQKRAEALSRAIGRARKRLTAEQQAVAAEQAARARQAAAQAAQQAARQAAAQAAQPAPASPAATYWPAAAPTSAAPRRPSSTPPAPAPTQTHQAPPPPVHTTTRSSGSHPTGEPSEPDDNPTGHDD